MIPFRQPFINRLFQFLNTEEGTAPDHTVGNQAEPTFHLIEPRTAGGCEVQMEPFSFPRFEPALDGLALMAAVVIQNEMDIQVRWDFLLQLL